MDDINPLFMMLNSAVGTLVQELSSKWKGLLDQIIEGCKFLHSE